MADKVPMLALSPTMENGVIARWIKSEGDAVKNGELLCEVETDKATMEYESINDGVLLKILVPAGQEAAVGDTIAIVGQGDEDISDLLEEEASGLMPSVDEGSVESAAIAASVGEKVEAAAEKQGFETAAKPAPTQLRSSPLARKLAADHGLNIEDIAGSGPQGRIIEADVETYISQQGVAAPVTAEATIPVTAKRRVIAERLVQSKFTAPHYYLKVTVHVDELLRERASLNADREEKVSFNAYLIKFVAEVLQRHPMVNATWNTDTIIKHARVDMAVAVAQEDGLVTPIVRDCHNKGILAIDRELKTLIEKTRQGRLRPDDYSNSTFTLTNLGSAGIDEFTAIINPPNSAILAVGRFIREPVVDEDDQIVVHTVMRLTLSCDHRIIDGAVGAAFLGDLREMFEHPVAGLY